MYWLTNRLINSSERGHVPVAARSLSVCCLLFLSMCTPPVKKGHGIFSVDSLLHAQASQLTNMRASIDKEVVLGTNKEEVSLTPADTVGWLKELEVFSVMESINKPINRERYKTTETTDTRSNLRIRAIETTDELPVLYVRLFYQGKPANIRKIEASYSETNGLYQTSRLLSMEFDNMNGLPVITSYSISGGQKMFMDDTVRYDIKGRVRIGN